MISKNELRVGNYFIHNGNWNTFNHKGIFKWTESEWFALGECTISLDDIKPIPITEEILLKCGFELKGVIFRINNGFADQFDVNYSPSRNIYYYDSSKYGIYTEVEIKHLHQLQNLYYALTGKELGINL